MREGEEERAGVERVWGAGGRRDEEDSSFDKNVEKFGQVSPHGKVWMASRTVFEKLEMSRNLAIRYAILFTELGFCHRFFIFWLNC